MVLVDDAPGWGAAHVASLAQALTRRGHQVTVHGPRHRVPAPRAGGDELHLGDHVDALRAAWEREKPDLVHAHFLPSGLAALLAAQRSGVPVVQSFHGVAPTDRNGVERLVGKESALVIASAEEEMLDLAAVGVPRPRIKVVARGVDTGLFQPLGVVARRTKLRRVVTAVDPLSDNGVADLVAALPRLPDVELVVAGAAASRLAQWARRHGVEKRTHLVGPVARQDMPALLRSADVVACVPRRTSWSPLVLEAMACGAPVVASAVGGLTDAVIDDVTGVLVPPGGMKQLVRALREVLDDETLRTACGIAAVDRVNARHSWPDVAVGVERLYGTVPGVAERLAPLREDSQHTDAELVETPVRARRGEPGRTADAGA
ncbi:glycosyl transferase [Lentzea cavernae]|uniref:Glycosyl transferase n=2 Tax=Lentzea cavernae TaxID=2020703 RepID=A0ABQ3MF98_9PSEU|nr:glycosyl transferase [Lentzea cavernae]